MRIEQIQAFVVVSETGSFGQAAKRCGVTQSTISRQVQNLESHLNTSLFHRQAKARLTIAGEKLLPHAKRICQEWDRIEEKIQDLLQGELPELCVAGIHSVCAYFLPPILQKFCQSHPQVQLRVTALGSDRAIKVLRDGLVDIAVVMNNKYLTSTSDMVIKHLYHEPIQVLVSRHHALAEKTSVTITDLAPYSQIIFKDGYGMQRIVQEVFGNHGYELDVAMELNTLDAFRGVIRQGNFIALLPESALHESKSDPSLAIVPIKMSYNDLTSYQLTREVILITSKDRLEIPTVRDFFHLVYEYAKQKTSKQPLSR